MVCGLPVKIRIGGIPIQHGQEGGQVGLFLAQRLVAVCQRPLHLCGPPGLDFCGLLQKGDGADVDLVADIGLSLCEQLILPGAVPGTGSDSGQPDKDSRCREEDGQ